MSISDGALKGNPPVPFTGDRKHSNAFLISFKIFRVTNHHNETMSNPYSRVTMALTYMQGDTMDIWKEEQLDKLVRDVTGGTPETSESLWDNFEKSFKEAFTNTNAKREAYQELLGLKQRDNLDTFIAHFRHLVKQAGIDPNDHGCIELFKEGLKSELTIAVIQSPAFDPQTRWSFNQWVQEAQ